MLRNQLFIKMSARLNYFILSLSFGYLALLTRSDIAFPSLIKVYGGDTLWAVMTYFLICFVLPKRAGVINLLLALLLSFSVETSQLYQASWVRDIRSTHLGGLLLGHGFKVSDLICYTLGNISAFLADRLTVFVYSKRSLSLD